LLDEEVKRLTIQDNTIKTVQKRKPASSPWLLQKVFANPIVRIISSLIVLKYFQIFLYYEFPRPLVNCLMIYINRDKFVFFFRYETSSCLSVP